MDATPNPHSAKRKKKKKRKRRSASQSGHAGNDLTPASVQPRSAPQSPPPRIALTPGSVMSPAKPRTDATPSTPSRKRKKKKRRTNVAVQEQPTSAEQSRPLQQRQEQQRQPQQPQQREKQPQPQPQPRQEKQQEKQNEQQHEQPQTPTRPAKPSLPVSPSPAPRKRKRKSSGDHQEEPSGAAQSSSGLQGSTKVKQPRRKKHKKSSVGDATDPGLGNAGVGAPVADSSDTADPAGLAKQLQETIVSVTQHLNQIGTRAAGLANKVEKARKEGKEGQDISSHFVEDLLGDVALPLAAAGMVLPLMRTAVMTNSAKGAKTGAKGTRRRQGGSSKRYTAEDDDLLRDMLAEHASAQDIAKALGRGVSAIKQRILKFNREEGRSTTGTGKAASAKKPARKKSAASKPASTKSRAGDGDDEDEDDETQDASAGGHEADSSNNGSDDDDSDNDNDNGDAASQDAPAPPTPAAPKATRPRWTAEDDATLLKMKGAGKTVQQMAEAFGRSSGAVAQHLRKVLRRNNGSEQSSSEKKTKTKQKDTAEVVDELPPPAPRPPPVPEAPAPVEGGDTASQSQKHRNMLVVAMLRLPHHRGTVKQLAEAMKETFGGRLAGVTDKETRHIVREALKTFGTNVFQESGQQDGHHTYSVLGTIKAALGGKLQAQLEASKPLSEVRLSKYLRRVQKVVDNAE